MDTLAFFEAIVNCSEDAIIGKDLDGIITSWNPAAERLFGYAAAEILGRPDTILIPEERRGEEARIVDQLKQGEAVDRFETGLQHKDGHLIDVSVTSSPIRDRSGRIIGASKIVRDITARKRNELLLREKTLCASRIIESAMDAIITMDDQHRIQIFNPAAEKMFGRTTDEIVGRSISELMPQRFREGHVHHVARFAQTGTTNRRMGDLGSVIGLRANGEEFPIEASISQMLVDGSRTFTVILRDISANKEHERKIAEQAALLDAATEAITVRDLNGVVLYWSKGAERMYGWTAQEAIGRRAVDLFFPDGQALAEATAAALIKGVWSGEAEHVTKQGHKLSVDARWTLLRDEFNKPRGVFTINLDITSRKKLEAQYLRAQRMESIGTLAGGIAHDLNNMLAPIVMAVDVLKLNHSDNARDQAILNTLRESAARATDIVRQILTFARGIDTQRLAVRPEDLIKDLARILGDTLLKQIVINIKAESDLWSISGDPTQLHQVLLNLCLNARDAMLGGGVLTIGASNIELDENYAAMNIKAKPGCYVLLSVTDTGTGISPDIVDKIFDPFFTTKEVGQGTGLGLATSASIIENHGGFLNVYSEVGKGTTFKVYLPAKHESSAEEITQQQEALPRGLRELILVVDDESSIREISRQTLEAFGYEVITAADGTEAVALYAENRDKIDVVLTDMMMPNMDGPTTIRVLRKMNPNVRIVAASGLMNVAQEHAAAVAGAQEIIQKPYTATTLLAALRNVIHPKV